MFETVGFFFSINKCKCGQPIVHFIGPINCFKNTDEPPKDFFWSVYFLCTHLIRYEYLMLLRIFFFMMIIIFIF